MAIGPLLEEKQSEFAWDFEFKLIGASAFTTASDLWNASGFVKKHVEKVHFNGYLYGVGGDTILALLALFRPSPKGLILVDIDPAVVLSTKMFVLCLEENKTIEEFLSTATFYEALSERLLLQEKNTLVKEQMQAHLTRAHHQWALNFRVFSPEFMPFWMKEGYSVLHALAKNKEIAVLHGDLFDPRLLACLTTLPGWSAGSNVAYLANASDHIHRHVSGKYSKEQFVALFNERKVAPLCALKNTSFVDTTQASSYQLRLRADPYFCCGDF